MSQRYKYIFLPLKWQIEGTIRGLCDLQQCGHICVNYIFKFIGGFAWLKAGSLFSFKYLFLSQSAKDKGNCNLGSALDTLHPLPDTIIGLFHSR